MRLTTADIDNCQQGIDEDTVHLMECLIKTGEFLAQRDHEAAQLRAVDVFNIATSIGATVSWQDCMSAEIAENGRDATVEGAYSEYLVGMASLIAHKDDEHLAPVIRHYDDTLIRHMAANAESISARIDLEDALEEVCEYGGLDADKVRAGNPVELDAFDAAAKALNKEQAELDGDTNGVPSAVIYSESENFNPEEERAVYKLDANDIGLMTEKGEAQEPHIRLVRRGDGLTAVLDGLAKAARAPRTGTNG